MEVSNEVIARNLAMMLRRMIWQIEKLPGESSLKTLAGNAKNLLGQYGLQGDIVRDVTQG